MRLSCTKLLRCVVPIALMVLLTLADCCCQQAKFELYWQLATKDPRVIGIKPYHYMDEPRANPASPNSKFSNQFSNGATRYPLLMHSIREKGQALKRAVGPH
jgi:hypothetical protein